MQFREWSVKIPLNLAYPASRRTAVRCWSPRRRMGSTAPQRRHPVPWSGNTRGVPLGTALCYSVSEMNSRLKRTCRTTTLSSSPSSPDHHCRWTTLGLAASFKRPPMVGTKSPMATLASAGVWRNHQPAGHFRICRHPSGLSFKCSCYMAGIKCGHGPDQ